MRQPSHDPARIAAIRQVAIAIQDYKQQKGEYPPPIVTDDAGRPMHSWRVLILPFLGYQDVFDAYDFNEPWNGPNNIRLIDRRPEVFRALSRSDTQSTSILALVGLSTIWESGKPSHTTNGLSKDVLLVDSGRTTLWTKPEDLSVSERIAAFRGAIVSFADGRTVPLPEEIDQQILTRLMADGA